MSGLPERYSSLPIEKKVGQLFMIGLPGEQLDESTYGLLVGINPSGVCLFARNTRAAESTRRLLASVRDALLFEPFLSLDQEGGLVDRLRRILEPMPSAEEVSLKGSLEDIRTLARITSQAIRTLGFNMNFAPVIDVVTEERANLRNGLLSRGFGRTREDVVEMASAYLEELQAGGIVGCVKHFPGLAAAEVDAHEELPSVPVDEATLREVDLYPYTKMLPAGDVKAVMTGHAAYPGSAFQIEDKRGAALPSSLSPAVVTGLLRDEFGFEGISLTDDLEMGAIVRNYGIGEACVMAVEAGHDLLLICNSSESVKRGYRAVLEAALNGRISETRLNVSLERIFRVRGALSPPTEFDPDLLDSLSEEIRELKAKLA